MRIGLLSPSIYMSPTHYGDMIFAPRDLSIHLADGLVAHGHEVYFFTAPDVPTRATLVPGDAALIAGSLVETKLKDLDTSRAKWASFYSSKKLYEVDLTSQCYHMAREGKLEVIHSYHDMYAHFYDGMTGVPTVYTLHDPLPTDTNGLDFWLQSRFSQHAYVSISDAFRRGGAVDLSFVGTVYHGIDTNLYPLGSGNGGYVCAMGRMVPEKGLDDAIGAAGKADVPIQIATTPEAQLRDVPYYTKHIQPLLTSHAATLVGHMTGVQKAAFLGGAQALLFPIHWEEPFGMVMIEAMACGTPVIAYDRGSVSEIVRDGVTGFVVDPADGIAGLVAAVKRIGEIDRAACRRHVEETFSIAHMVQGYERVYETIVGRS